METQLEDVNTIEATARYLKVSVPLLGEMARKKRIGAMKAGRQWVFPRQVIDDFVASQTVQAVPPANPWGLSGSNRRTTKRSAA